MEKFSEKKMGKFSEKKNFKEKIFFLIRLSIFTILLFTINCKKIREKDIIPPGNIDDLKVAEKSFWYVDVEFTAPGDDGFKGKAQRYDIRYSDSEDFRDSPELNFETGTPAPGTPDPADPLTKQRVRIKGLQPKKKYYIALKAIDDAENTSRISNLVEVETDDVPGGSGKFLKVLPSYQLEKIITDGIKIYAAFPFSLIEENPYQITPISPIFIRGSEIVFQDGKFITIGGVDNEGKLLQKSFIVYPSGETKIATVEGELSPFDGFYEKGVLEHRTAKWKDAKWGDGFIILGGRKFSLPSPGESIAKKLDKFVELSLIPFFKIDGEKIIFYPLYPTGATTPQGRGNPIVFETENGVIMWGGRIAENLDIFSSDIYLLTKDGRWIEYLLEVPITVDVIGGCTARDEENKRVIILGEFKERGVKYSAIFNYFDIGRGVLVKTSPEGFPQISVSTGCSMLYKDKKLYILTTNPPQILVLGF